MDFVFERVQKIKCEIRDADNYSGTESELIGTVEFEMAQLLGSRGNLLFLDIMFGSTKRGKFTVRCEKKSSTNENISLQMTGIQMTSFGFFSSIVPVLILWKPIMPPELQQQYVNNPDYLDEVPLKSC